MTVKAFVINNVPWDKDFLYDFVESTLEVEVESLEYLKGTLLVTLAESINFEEAAKTLKLNHGDIDDLLGPFEVLDPGQCDNKVVVEKLDGSYLSVKLLKLYIESTFADGYNVVSEHKVIPEHSLTVLTLTAPDVVKRVLENRDHLPLPSVHYHIQIKPFYRNYHSAIVNNPILEKIPSENAASLIDKNNDRGKREHCSSQDTHSCKTSPTAEFGLQMTSKGNELTETKILGDTITAEESNALTKANNGDKSMKTQEFEGMVERKISMSSSNVSQDNFETMEKETLDLPKPKYRLLKDSLQSMDCQVGYNKKKQQLTIHSKNASLCKSHAIDLVHNVSKSISKLSKECLTVINREGVMSKMKTFVKRELENTEVELCDNSLTIYSLGNSDKNLKVLIDRYFCTKSIQLPEGISMDRIRECNARCKDYLLTMVYDKGTLTLTGLVEDVSLASDDVKRMMEDCKLYSKTFEITGKDALFVKKFEMYKLESVLQGAEITEKRVSGEKISLQYSCRKCQIKELDEKLKIFKGSVKRSPVDLSELNKEDLALIRSNLKTDTDFIPNFETANHCCVVFEDFKDNDFFGTSAVSNKGKQETRGSVTVLKKRRPRVPPYYKKQKRVKRLPSCTIQIKPFGNIARERTELLVCGVDNSLNLNKSRVSQALMKLDSSLQSQMNTFAFSTNGVYVDQRQLPNLKCKAIAFVKLQRWQQGVSDQQLTAAVKEVLDTANQIGIRSVSFPPLGFGRAFQFPAHEASQAVITAIDSFLNGNPGKSQITLINCLTPDKHLYNAMNKEVDIVFKKKTDNSGGDDDDGGDDDGGDDDGGDDDGDQEQEEGATALHYSSEEDSETPELQMEAVNSDSPISFIIVHNDEKDIATKFKVNMNKTWLHVDSFYSDKVTCWSPKLMNDMIQMAKMQGVWVGKVQDPTTKKLNLKIKGNNKDVHAMKNKIYDHIIKITGPENKTLLSPLAPKRGTIDFLKYAADCFDIIPSYWNPGKHRGNRHDSTHLVDVDAKTLKAISDLMTKCWDQHLTGQGYDALNIPANSRIKVTKVQRLENKELFTKYSMKRGSIFREMANRGQICKDIEKLSRSKGAARTRHTLPKFMTTELYGEINECYLFHGTKSDIIKSICKQGMDSRLSSHSALFGQGVYLAESSTKSDQYTDPRDSRLPQGTNLTMILTRASMGDVFVCDDKHESVQSKTSQKLRRPPCTSCFKDVCKCAKPLYHSVLGDGKWIFREFIVYDNHQCYPEYFITYQRY